MPEKNVDARLPAASHPLSGFFGLFAGIRDGITGSLPRLFHTRGSFISVRACFLQGLTRALTGGFRLTCSFIRITACFRQGITGLFLPQFENIRHPLHCGGQSVQCSVRSLFPGGKVLYFLYPVPEPAHQVPLPFLCLLHHTFVMGVHLNNLKQIP
ncbi:Uncharacterised protein [Salmonella enterica subsp. enterica]|uniref:Uncharacterized protein n=1 Tax=Salmonella enterica I TaxID=59201 RepID=A0A447PEH6_SALET|nr:Uncharacterised protein [Salmonella enterica subsp. enterica]